MKKSNNKMLKAGAGYVIGNYLLKGITFLSAPIFTRLLSVEEYGIMGTYTSYEAMIYILIGLALHSSINSASIKYKKSINKFISSIIALTLFSVAVWLVVCNILYPFYGEKIGFSRVIINILLLNAGASALQQIYSVKISLKYEYKSYLKMSYFNALGNLGLSVFLLLTICSENRVLGRVIGIAAPLIIVGVFIVYSSFKEAKPIISKDYWKYAVKYSLPIVPHGISQIILNSFDKIMIKNMIGAADAGIYSFAYNVNRIVLVAKNSLENIWKPWFYEKMEQKEYKDIRKGASNYAIGIAFFTVLVLLVCPEIIKILGSKQYWDSVECVVPVVIGGYFSFLYSIPSIVEYFYEKTKYIAIGTVAAAIINIVLNYIFIGKYGYIAAAYTTLFTYFLYFVFHFILARKIHGSNLFSLRDMIGVSVIVILVGFLTIAIKNMWIMRWSIEIALGILFIIWAEKEFAILDKIKQKFLEKRQLR